MILGTGSLTLDLGTLLEGNDKINITDFGLMEANYGKYSPIPVP
jgi:hypothetical protein